MKWEVINEGDENQVNKGTVVIKKEPIEADPDPNVDVAEHDIFGGAVSDSEDEDAHLNMIELDENSQNSADDSHLTDSNSVLVCAPLTLLLFISFQFRAQGQIYGRSLIRVGNSVIYETIGVFLLLWAGIFKTLTVFVVECQEKCCHSILED